MNIRFKLFLLLFVFIDLSLLSNAQDSWHSLKYLYSENTGWIKVKDDINNPNISVFFYNGKSEKHYKLFIKVQDNKILFLSNDRIDREIILDKVISSQNERVDSFGSYSFIKYDGTVLIKDKGFQRTGTLEYGTVNMNNKKYNYIKTFKGKVLVFIW